LGTATDGHAVAPLKDDCQSLGYTAFDWGQGIYTRPLGDPDIWLRDLADKVSGMLHSHSQPTTLISNVPDDVYHVISLPFFLSIRL